MNIKRYTIKEQREIIRSYGRTKTPEQLAEELGRTPTAIILYAFKLRSKGHPVAHRLDEYKN